MRRQISTFFRITGRTDEKNEKQQTGRRRTALLFAVLFCLTFFSFPALSVQAESSVQDTAAADTAAAAQDAQTSESTADDSGVIRSNADPDWPQGPEVDAVGAVLMEPDTGTILYDKNMDQRLYPASTTKLMTCLIAAEKLDLNDTVTFSQSAIDSVPAGGSNIGMDVGQTITVEQALYGIMVGSANEVATAIAEKTAGSVSAFSDLMNAKAAELGCTGTHFVNANGLHDDSHYTTPHDLALIAQAFFSNPILLKIGNTPSYHFTPTATQPDDFILTNKHKLITGEVACDGVIGGKTGYTEKAGECLVTGCERGGMRLICVVMNEPDPMQYSDSAKLLEYGYNNFSKVSIADKESRFAFAGEEFLENGKDLLGSSAPVFSLSDSSVIIPVNTDFNELTPTVTAISADTAQKQTASSGSETGSAQNQTAAAGADGTITVADIAYRFHNIPVGSAQLLMKKAASPVPTAASNGTGSSGSQISSSSAEIPGFRGSILYFIKSIRSLLDELHAKLLRISDSGTLYINVLGFAVIADLTAVVLIVIILLEDYFNSYTHPNRRQHRRRPRRDADFTWDRFRRYDHIDTPDD